MHTIALLESLFGGSASMDVADQALNQALTGTCSNVAQTRPSGSLAATGPCRDRTGGLAR